MDTFWTQVDAQLDRIETDKPDTFEGVKAALEPILDRGAIYGTDCTGRPDAAFFAGSGGDRTLWSALHAAGWALIWAEANYYYMAQHPITGDILTHVEGDVYKGDRR